MSSTHSQTDADTLRAWFVTAPLAPDVRLAGPFATRDEAELACLQRVSERERRAAFVAGKLPVRYVPRQFAVRVAVLHLYSPPEPPPQPRPRAAPPTKQHKLRLPKLVHTYDRTSLLALCRVLGFEAPNSGADKAEIIAYLEYELTQLEKG